LLNPNDDAHPKLHDLLPEAADWQASTLILHGQQDNLITVLQAVLLRQRLASLGKPHRLVVLLERGHRLPLRDIKEPALAFLQENGGSACRVNAL
jgi:dipeptidyl aminopeptidase/acylaminoacyl peptidase